MEISTIWGFVIGIICIFSSIFLTQGSAGEFLNLASLLLVPGGVFAATLIAYPFTVLKDVAGIAGASFKAQKFDFSADVENVASIAEIARREGILALEESAVKMDNRFLQKGVSLIADGSDAGLIRTVLETELAFVKERYGRGQAVFNSMASLAPAFGLIGTLIGLVVMLGRLDNPAVIGPGLAYALVSTLYGVVLANFICTPISKKIGVMGETEYLRKELILEGVMSIQDGDSPRMIREKLYAYLPSAQRIRTAEGQER